MPASPDDTVLLTAAAGKQATDLIPLLLPHFARLRLQVLTEQSRDRLADKYPTAEVVAADLDDEIAVRDLMRGVACAYIIGPTFHTNETAIIKHLIDAAVSETHSGIFRHLVYSSVLHPHLTSLANHDAKRLAEEYLHERGPDLKYTILQPSHFADNFPIRQLLTQLIDHNSTTSASSNTPEKGGRDQVVKLVYSPNSDPTIPFSFSTTLDCAHAAVRVLRERERHFFATYELVSSGGEAESLTYTTAVRHVQDAINSHLVQRRKKRLEEKKDYDDYCMDIEHVQVEIQTNPTQQILDMFASSIADSSGSSGRKMDMGVARKLFEYYNVRGLYGNSFVLEHLLDRKPLAYAQWADMKVGAVWAELDALSA